MVQVNLSRANLLFSDGVNPRYHRARRCASAKTPAPAHLRRRQRVGRLRSDVRRVALLDTGEELDNSYYAVAREKPSPLNDDLFT